MSDKKIDLPDDDLGAKQVFDNDDDYITIQKEGTYLVKCELLKLEKGDRVKIE